ncbi:platelet-activating factor receptor isoform X2 [Pseudophryne corroboree]|uniref:platelet-activating factor receptor isoform X2 n=1 Tax=Pseudophryne corroboree TaxID=495146 RepID=UPI003081FB49
MPAEANASPEDPCTVDSAFRYTLFTVSYSIIFIFGFIANAYVLWVFARLYPAKRLSEIKIFMINLTVADLLFLVTLPLWIVYYNNRGDWIMPDFLCNIAGCFFFINTYCSVAFLGVISYNRYQAVTRPVETAQSTARVRGMCISICVWILIIASSLYFLVVPGTNQVQSNDGHNYTHCFEGYSIDNRDPVAIIHFILIAAFFLVFLIIVICNLVIFKTLITQTVAAKQSAEMKQRALYMVGAVLGVFVICFVPHHIVHGPWTLTVLRLWHENNCGFRQSLNDAHQITLCLMSTNCMLDPIIYCFLTKKFRKHLSERIQTMRRSRDQLPAMDEPQKLSIAP